MKVKKKEFDFPKPFDGLHLGELVRLVIRQKGLKHIWVAEQVGLTKQGFANKLNKKWFGSVDDLIKVGIVLKTDFVSPLLISLRDSGIKLDQNQIEKVAWNFVQELETLKGQVKVLTVELNKYQAKEKRRRQKESKKVNSNDT